MTEAACFPTILLPATRAETLSAQFATARALAAGASHHIVGLFVEEPLPVSHPAEMTWHADMMDAFETSQRQAFEALESTFAQLCRSAGVAYDPASRIGDGPVSARFDKLKGLRDVETGEYARQADIVIMAASQDGLVFPERAIAEAVLARGGRGLLLTPAKGLTRRPAKALVGWNGSLEAARAVAAALPLLKAIGHVHVLSLGDVPAGCPKAADIDATLRRHGIRASHAALDASKAEAGERLQAEAERVGAEVMVLGAYSRARWQEFILGGVTQSALDLPRMPMLLAH